MEILRTEQVRKVYGKEENQVVAVDNVSFSVEKGETPDMEMTASATDGSTIEDEWIAYYVDDYTAYEMLYTDSDY